MGVEELATSGLPEEHRRLAELPTAALSDALDALGLAGTMGGISPLWGRSPYRMVGTARTVLQAPRRVDAAPGVSYTKHLGLVDGGLRPGDVVLVSTPSRVAASSWGFLLSLRCKVRGVAGTVLDGTVRDPAEILELGYALFVRTDQSCPAGSKFRLETVAVDVPITCGGVLVSPGDIVVGDDSGVVVIPPARVAEVIEGATAIVARERELARVIRAGGRFADVS
ncbi:MAG TPA: RraA family protein [Candidatus Dormibacteraeota bacterium]|nr:RraA family protein [Candidatus Dormibacteraeota bacterium]